VLLVQRGTAAGEFDQIAPHVRHDTQEIKIVRAASNAEELRNHKSAATVQPNFFT